MVFPTNSRPTSKKPSSRRMMFTISEITATLSVTNRCSTTARPATLPIARFAGCMKKNTPAVMTAVPNVISANSLRADFDTISCLLSVVIGLAPHYCTARADIMQQKKQKTAEFCH